MHIQTSDQEKLTLGYCDYTCNWGVHIAGLYETQQELEEIILGFTHEGAINGDKQLYCPNELSKEHFISRYCEKFPEHKHHPEDPDLFSIQHPKELYYPNGIFSPISMDKGLENYFRVSQKYGKRNIRATADMSWALEAVPGVEHLMAYESRLNYFIPNKPWISICLYNMTYFSGMTIMKVLQTHPYTISRGVITENPYFIDPDNWLEENAPEFLNDNLS